jgi:hypothetical protein
MVQVRQLGANDGRCDSSQCFAATACLIVQQVSGVQQVPQLLPTHCALSAADCTGSSVVAIRLAPGCRKQQQQQGMGLDGHLGYLYDPALLSCSEYKG